MLRITNNSNTPKVSVLMPVYNGEKYLAKAVKSILEQSFRDFELLVVDDGSTDRSAQILRGFLKDTRVSVIRNERNLGLIATLHKGLKACRAPLIARMDADDISHPQRLQLQVDYLNAHPEIEILGGAIRYIEMGVKFRGFSFPLAHEAIKPAMLFFSPLPHPALMFRRDLVERELFCFDDEFRHAEDYHLWSRLLNEVRSANLPQVLLDYRVHSSQVSSAQASPQYQAALSVRKSILNQARVDWTERDLMLHEAAILGRSITTDDLQNLERWFCKLEQSNEISGYWDGRALHELLCHKFTEVLRRTTRSFDSAPPLGKADEWIFFDAELWRSLSKRRRFINPVRILGRLKRLMAEWR